MGGQRLSPHLRGGFLLAGRLGDRFGHRRLFLAGIGVFTLASLACSLSPTRSWLIAARAMQGFVGAVVSSEALSLVVATCPESRERARAMGVFTFVNSGGGTVGVVLGAVLTGALNWRWIFLVNVPVGAAVEALAPVLLPPCCARAQDRLDVGGAATATAALIVAVLAITGGTPRDGYHRGRSACWAWLGRWSARSWAWKPARARRWCRWASCSAAAWPSPAQPTCSGASGPRAGPSGASCTSNWCSASTPCAWASPSCPPAC